MFGYIVVNKPELKVREFDRYQEYYCGLCHALKDEYGQLGRFCLSYDMTFLAILLCGLYEPELARHDDMCPLHPMQKRPYLSADIFKYVADMNVILMYYKCLDDWEDEKKAGRGLYALSLKKAMENLRERYPDKCKKIAKLLRKNSEAEKAFAGRKLTSRALDYLSGLSGKMLAEVFAMKDDEWNDELRKLGFYLGKFIYLSDAYADMEEDDKKGRFNAFASYRDRENFENWVHSLLLMSATSAARYFEMLPIIEDAQILRNVIYAGIWTGYQTAKRRRADHDRSLSDTGRQS